MPAQPRDEVHRDPASPLFTGVPWWGAVLIAVTATLVGLAVEAGSGHKELGSAFAVCYALGCVVAVLTVARAGIFTAVIQPPLLLFVSVPLAYYLFHESSFRGLKEAVITCGYPLIERFPLMLFTTSAVLLIGLIRWYLAMTRPAEATSQAREPGGALAGLSTKLSSAFAGNGSVDERAGQRAARPRHVADRSGRSRKSAQSPPPRRRRARPADEAAPPRPRRGGTGRPEREEQWSEQPRRRRRDDPREPRRSPAAQRGEPRERREYRDPRVPREYREPRPPRESRDIPREYRDPYPPRTSRSPRYETYDPRRDDQPFPPEQQRRRPATNGSAGTHHPVSRVRYRDSEPTDSGDRDPYRPRRRR